MVIKEGKSEGLVNLIDVIFNLYSFTCSGRKQSDKSIQNKVTALYVTYGSLCLYFKDKLGLILSEVRIWGLPLTVLTAALEVTIQLKDEYN